MYVDQLVTPQLLNWPHELEQLHIPKMTLYVLLNDGKMGTDATNSV